MHVENIKLKGHLSIIVYKMLYFSFYNLHYAYNDTRFHFRHVIFLF